MTVLDEMLLKKAEEYKLKSYSELKDIVGEVQCFADKYKGKSFIFEVHAVLGNENEIKVMIECSRNIFPLNFFGKHRCFAVNLENEKKDIKEEEYWE
jgi:hypothetical protein